ncbi:hypothetical protein BB561_000287 [Smittium simulii]|uniref:glutamate synthase (NADH) n=1 Tax=Smittium simulii TaxID=133385 RepID=A0A2T9YZR3_9FUNG|nr:hypothetical protein BB561_000287 [Smittium simulii]
MVDGWATVFPEKAGIYDPALEKDGCGVGFLINIDGRKSHSILEQAQETLTNMTHRGASGADPLDGDGAGIMTSLPHEFFKKTWETLLHQCQHKTAFLEVAAITKNEFGDIDLDSNNIFKLVGGIFQPNGYSTGNIFLKNDGSSIDLIKSKFEEVAFEVGLIVAGWRVVPTEKKYIGSISKTAEPCVLQPLVLQKERFLDILSYYLLNGDSQHLCELKDDSETAATFERKLYLLRKKSTQIIKNTCNDGGWFFVCSLSTHRIVYKGLMVPKMLNKYYPDLADLDFKAHYALVHSRFSTNTFPSWDRAQPLRFCAHNGEINTLQGNKNWMRSREGMLKSKHFTSSQLEQLFPVIEENGSDSQAFDNVLELMVLAGQVTLPEAVMIMIPEAWHNIDTTCFDKETNDFNEHKKYFYEWASAIMEPWDGPALLTFSDSRYCGAVLDRNGLRPCRYYITDDNMMICGSEVGAISIDNAKIKQKGRLMPGKVLLVDTLLKKVIEDKELKQLVCSKNNYKEWGQSNTVDLCQIAQTELKDAVIQNIQHQEPHLSEKDIDTKLNLLNDPRLAIFNYSIEEINMIILPMLKVGKEALGSMGNDAILACLDSEPRTPFDYMRQMFAQVTNPPIDPIRESIVMSLECMVGPEVNLLETSSSQLKRIKLNTFLLSDAEFNVLCNLNNNIKSTAKTNWDVAFIDITFSKSEGVNAYTETIKRISEEAVNCVNNGAKVVVLTDKGISMDRVGVFSLLAVGAVHHKLVDRKLRLKAAIVLEAGDVREVHHFCTLLGYGVDAIYPYFVYELIKGLKDAKVLSPDADENKMLDNYKKSINDGVKKVMSKMGISTLQSYKGAQTFEALGISSSVVDVCMKNTPTRIGGATFQTFAIDSIAFHERGFPSASNFDPILHKFSNSIWSSVSKTGEYHWNRGGVKHSNTPAAIANMQNAVRTKNQKSWDEYTKEQWDNGSKNCTLRGMLDFEYAPENQIIPIEEVEPWAEIVKRFCTGGMSYGSISLEAHTTLAIAMNKLGGKSNSGEGGEDENRYKISQSGESQRSAIKQVASGRFGVTSHYLCNADDLQIKMAQGAKPGEGGELPGHKVSGKIAQTRHSTSGVGLISPPPHHDIYSIEDLKQLIYDLKGANPIARISVKLVSINGVGVVASGVTKAGAGHIVISGHDGGTGASRWTGIKYAGLPWELGLAETHQTLKLNNLRNHVVIQTDGQVKTGREIVMAAILGADEIGFATAPLIALGCTMMRKCHLNTCPVGIATQDPELRKKFTGKPEHLINFFYYLAEDVRKIMASLGVRKYSELIGRYELVKANNKTTNKHGNFKCVNLKNLLVDLKPKYEMDMTNKSLQKNKTLDSFDTIISDRLEMKLINTTMQNIEQKTQAEITSKITNLDRGFGALFSFYISKNHGKNGLPDSLIKIKLNGSAGQSFGAYLASGMFLELEGDSNDYVGKGLSGGKLAIYPPKSSSFNSSENVIVGNVCLYGATSGEAYFNGIAAERFAVRNSGAIAVVEGVGDHGCEYMTGGIVVVLGSTGKNFAAGMSGGIAYVFEQEKGVFTNKCNHELVELESLQDHKEIEKVKEYISNHKQYTGSKLAESILNNWNICVRMFIKVIPTDYKNILEKQKNTSKTQNKTSEKPSNLSSEPNSEKFVVDLEDTIPNKQNIARNSSAGVKKASKLRGFIEEQRQNEEYRNPIKRIKDWKEVSSRLSEDKLVTQASRCMDCGVPFCQSDNYGCPIGNAIPKWNELVYNGQWKEAFECLMSTNNFPEFTGRVCPAPCEGACVLGINEQPVGIKSIEAAIIDRAWSEGWVKPTPPSQRTGFRVAIIGSGPAGLAAADQLNLAGHTVEVYEREDRVGGLLVYGIPNMKLDKQVVQRRVDKMASEGVVFVTNTAVGKDISLQSLYNNFDAVMLATGSTWPRDLKIEGRELNGIELAVDFLTQNTKHILDTQNKASRRISAKGKNVIVIGGGDTGTDCISTSVRQEAASIVNFELLPQPPKERSSENPWPLYPRTFKVDYGHAEAEAVYGQDPRIYCITSKKFIGDSSGHITGIETSKVEWQKDPKSNGWKLQELENTKKVFPADLVLISMGFLGPESKVLEEFGIKLGKTGNIATETGKYSTNIEGLFAAGDCRRGQSLVVWGIDEGRQAAREIDQYFINKGVSKRKTQLNNKIETKTSGIKSKTKLPITGGVIMRTVELCNEFMATSMLDE